MPSMSRSLRLACAALAVAALLAVAPAAAAPAEGDAPEEPAPETTAAEAEDPAPTQPPPEPADPKGDGSKQPPPSADAPGKGPAAATPKDALKLLAVAMHEGDASQIRGLLYVANEHEGRMADAMAAMARALARLHAAAVKEFGEQGARELTGHPAGSPQTELERIDAADVSHSDGGDSATVAFKPDAGEEEPAPPVVLRKVDGRWRVPVSDLAKGVQADDLKQRLADLAVQTKVIGGLTKEIAAGKYGNADQAADAWNAKITEALSPRPRKPAEPAPRRTPKAPRDPDDDDDGGDDDDDGGANDAPRK